MSRIAHISGAGSGAAGGGLTDAELRATPVPVDTELPAAAALTDTTANPTVPGVGGFSMYWVGTSGTWSRWTGRDYNGTESGFAAPSVSINLPNGFSVGDANTQPVIGVASGDFFTDAMTWNSGSGGFAMATASISQGRVYNASTFSDERARAAYADGLSTGVPASGLMVFDGTNWDRARAGAPGADPGNVGIPAVQLHVSDGSNVRRVHSGLGDAASASTMVPSPGWAYNGATWDRIRTGRATGSVLADKVTAATSALSNVAGSASSVTLLAANAARRGATIMNDSSAILYVKFGTTASTTSFTVKMVADAYYEVPFDYTGRIDGIWASATGSARITELSA